MLLADVCHPRTAGVLLAARPHSAHGAPLPVPPPRTCACVLRHLLVLPLADHSHPQLLPCRRVWVWDWVGTPRNDIHHQHTQPTHCTALADRRATPRLAVSRAPATMPRRCRQPSPQAASGARGAAATGQRPTRPHSCSPVPLGSDTVARSCWSVYLGSMFSLACT